MAKAKKHTPLWRTALEAILIAVFIHTFLFRPFYIPSSSMKPNLLIGDYVIINKFSYGYSCYSPYFPVCSGEGRIFGKAPERGDVVVFSNPRDDRTFVKRVIGLPGERVKVEGGQVFINGEALPLTQLEAYPEKLTDHKHETVCVQTDDENCYVNQKLETLPNGLEIAIFDQSPRAALDNFREQTVPEGHYFVMGDNRDRSDDSRGQVGMLPDNRVIGKAKLIVFSSSGSSLFQVHKWRGDRFFKWVE